MPACLADPPYDVVVMLMDDMRFDQAQYFADTRARLAPNLVDFERAYVTTPLCCPERASFLSGGYWPQQTGVLQNDEPQGGATAFPDAGTMPVRMREAGIPTALLGKYLNHYELLDTYVPPGWTVWASFWHDAPWNDFDYQLGASGVNDSGESVTEHWDGYVTDWQVALATEFLDQHAGAGSFLYLSFRAPHDPHTPAAGDRDAFDGYTYRGRAWNEADLSDKPKWIREMPEIGPDSADLSDREAEGSNESLLAVDRAMVDLVEAVEAAGRLDRTVFVMTSDNGLLWGEHRLFEKGLPYEESIRVPLWVAHPDLAGRVDTGLVATNLDLAATVQELVGLPVQSEGRSLLPVLCGEVDTVRDDVRIETWTGGDRPWGGFVLPEWSFIQTGADEYELYNLVSDPYQEESLHGDPTYAELLEELSARLAVERGLVVLEKTLPDAAVGEAYDKAVPVAGGTPPYTWSIGDGRLPDGLALTDDGRIAGTPTDEDEEMLTIVVEDASVSPFTGLPQRHEARVRIKVGPGEATARRECGCATGVDARSGGLAAFLALLVGLRRGGARWGRVAPGPRRG